MIAWILVALLAAAQGSEYSGKGSISLVCANSSDNEVIHLPGDEDVTLDDNCRINSVVNLTIEGSPENRSTIRCTRQGAGIASVAFVFTNVTSLVIRNVNFEGCGGVLTEVDLAHYPSDCFFNFSAGHAAVVMCSFCTNLVLQNVTFTNNTGYAFAAISLIGNSLLDGVVIDGGNDPHLPYNSTMCTHPEYKYTCGFRGMLIFFVDSNQITQSSLSGVQIKNSIFNSNYDAPLESSDDPIRFQCIRDVFDNFYLQKNNSDIPDVGALTIVYNQVNFSARVDISDSNFTNNHGTCFGAVLVIFSLDQSSHGKQTFQNCNFFNNSPLIVPQGLGWSHIGADITLYMEFYGEGEKSDCISVLSSSFLSNKYFWELKFSSISMTHFPVTNGACTLYMEDIWVNVSMRLLFATGVSQSNSASVFLKDIQMIDHHASHYNLKSTAENYGLLTFSYVGNITLTGTSLERCKFYNLIGPVFIVRSSDLYLTGEMTFSNIVASKWAVGSVIMLQVDAAIWLQEPLNAIFCNNTAVVGGAIGSMQLAIEFCIILYSPLHFVTDENLSSLNITIQFSNNSADLAGNSIYFEKMYSCSMRVSPKIRVHDIQMLYNSTFEFINEVNNGLLEMSSTPSEVCLCKGELRDTSNINCAGDSLNMSRISTYPGKTFSVCVIVVDEIYNPVYSPVFTNLLTADPSYDQSLFNWELGYGQNVATVYGTTCTRLNYTLYITNDTNHIRESNGTLAIYPYGQQRCIAIPVTMEECPVGFSLIDGACRCDSLLSSKQFKCDIDNGTVTKNVGSEWVGKDLDGNLAYSSHCPDTYCSQETAVNVSDFNTTCIYNRSGVLCGTCSGNRSSVFGHSVCWECSNLWLLTIPLYAVACILLVIILFALRLTVAIGTISGVIFYANIFNVNTFFFLGYDSTAWLRIFISWLNLETGFPICFFDGMTDLHSTYLSFIIPVYLWLIVLVLIYLSRHFQRISNLTSRSAVPVLATLIHLSFSRLLRLVVDGMIYVELDISGSKSQQVVWYLDGNLQYFCKERLGLLILSILSLFLFLIPYTVFFTGIKFFLRFRTVNRFRPFIDAFCAPYKDKYNYWFGARLCVLVVCYLVYASLRNQPYLVILLQTIMLVCFTITQAVVMPYKNTLLNIIELFYLANSIIIYTVGLYSDEPRIMQIASNIIMTPAFLVFLAIIVYHVYTYILKEKVLATRFTKYETQRTGSGENELEDERTSLNSSMKPVSPRATYSAVAVESPYDIKHYLPGELREPLIESDTDD